MWDVYGRSPCVIVVEDYDCLGIYIAVRAFSHIGSRLKMAIIRFELFQLVHAYLH
jgi:hypothetical protein